jgi:two-component system CheB/CheR fusion protein
MALARHFDVVVSDIGMPGMTGHELARALRSMPEYRSIPMVAVTGFDMYDDRERSAEAGFSAHLRKPIDPSSLTRAISGIWH